MEKKIYFNSSTKEITVVDTDIMQYDSGTKEISFADKENSEKESNGVRTFLTRNKIFFETVFILMGTVMSFVVGVASINVGNAANAINQKQIEIQSYENLPQFEINYVDRDSKTEMFLDKFADTIYYDGWVEFNLQEIRDYYTEYRVEDEDDNIGYYSQELFVEPEPYQYFLDLTPYNLSVLLSGEYESDIIRTINKRLREDRLVIINKGGNISNAVINPYFIMEINLFEGTSETTLHVGLRHFFTYKNIYFDNIDDIPTADILMKNAYYYRTTVRNLEKRLREIYPNTRIAYNMYMNIQYQDFLKNKCDDWFTIERNWTLGQVYDQKLIDTLRDAYKVDFDIYYNQEDFEDLIMCINEYNEFKKE